MLKSSLCGYCDACILASGTKTVVGAEADKVVKASDRNDKQAMFTKYGSFTDCITEINNTQVDKTTQKIWMLLCRCIKNI